MTWEQKANYLEAELTEWGQNSFDAWAVHTLANAFRLSGKPDKAITFLEPHLSKGGLLAPFPASHLLYAYALFDVRRFNCAISFIEEKTKSDAILYANPSALTLKARALNAIGRRNDAISFLQAHMGPQQPLCGRKRARQILSRLTTS